METGGVATAFNLICPACSSVLVLTEKTPEQFLCKECGIPLRVDRSGSKPRFVSRSSDTTQPMSKEEREWRDECIQDAQIEAKRRRAQREDEWWTAAKMVFAVLVVLALIAQCASPSRPGSDRDACSGPARYC